MAEKTKLPDPLVASKYIVVPVDGSIDSLAHVIWCLRQEWVPLFLYIKGFIDEESAQFQLDNVIQWAEHILSGYSEGNNIVSSTIQSPQPHKRTNLFVDQVTTLPKTSTEKMAMIAHKMGVLAQKMECWRVFWPFGDMAASFQARQKIHVHRRYDEFKPLTYVAEWIDETREAQEQETDPEKVEYTGWFQHSFDPWQWVSSCKETPEVILHRSEQLNPPLRRTCGMCKRCKTLLTQYAEQYALKFLYDEMKTLERPSDPHIVPQPKIL